MKCSDCGINYPDTVVRTLKNGEEMTTLCDVCFKDALFDLVTNNESVAFSTDKRSTVIQ